MLSLKRKIDICNLNYKKEILINLFINLAILILFLIYIVLTKNLIISIYAVLILGLFNLFYFSRYSLIMSKNHNNLILEFINIFSYFRIYISTNRNVYVALKEVSNYASPFIQNKILLLLEEMDEDKSIRPFMNFSSIFEDKKVEEVMISIYQMIDEGNNENYLNQFINIFTSFKARIEKNLEVKRLNRFDTISSFSIVGVGVLMLLIMLGVVSMIGEMMI